MTTTAAPLTLGRRQIVFIEQDRVRSLSALFVHEGHDALEHRIYVNRLGLSSSSLAAVTSCVRFGTSFSSGYFYRMGTSVISPVRHGNRTRSSHGGEGRVGTVPRCNLDCRHDGMRQPLRYNPVGLCASSACIEPVFVRVILHDRRKSGNLHV